MRGPRGGHGGEVIGPNTKDDEIPARKLTRWSIFGNGTAKITGLGIHVADNREDLVIGNLEIERTGRERQ